MSRKVVDLDLPLQKSNAEFEEKLWISDPPNGNTKVHACVSISTWNRHGTELFRISPAVILTKKCI